MGYLLPPWTFVLTAIALVHFIRRRPDGFWLWVILFGAWLGALVYIFVEVVPDLALLRGAVNAVSRRNRIRALETQIQDNPAIGPREELADLYLENQEYAKARALYDAIITPRLDALDPYYRRGMAALGLNDAAAAIPDLEHVVASERRYDFHRALGLLAQAHALAGDRARAEELFKEATTISTLSETYCNYAEFLAREQRGAEAREMARRVLAKKPAMPRYLRRRERPWFRAANALLKRLPA